MIDKIIEGFAIGVPASIAASIIFLIFISKMKPRLAISNEISRSTDPDGKTKYEIKFMNLTRRRVIEIQVQLEAIKLIPYPKGYYNHPTIINLKKNYILEVGPKNDGYKRFDWRIISYDDLDRLSKENDYFRLTLIAKDSFSGYSQVYVKRFKLHGNLLWRRIESEAGSLRRRRVG